MEDLHEERLNAKINLRMARNFGHALDNNQFAQCQNFQLCCYLP